MENKKCKLLMVKKCIQEVLNYRFHLKMLFLRMPFKKGDCESTSIHFSSPFRLSMTLWCLELAKQLIGYHQAYHTQRYERI